MKGMWQLWTFRWQRSHLHRSIRKGRERGRRNRKKRTQKSPACHAQNSRRPSPSEVPFHAPVHRRTSTALALPSPHLHRPAEPTPQPARCTHHFAARTEPAAKLADRRGVMPLAGLRNRRHKRAARGSSQLPTNDENKKRKKRSSALKKWFDTLPLLHASTTSVHHFERQRFSNIQHSRAEYADLLRNLVDFWWKKTAALSKKSIKTSVLNQCACEFCTDLRTTADDPASHGLTSGLTEGGEGGGPAAGRMFFRFVLILHSFETVPHLVTLNHVERWHFSKTFMHPGRTTQRNATIAPPRSRTAHGDVRVSVWANISRTMKYPTSNQRDNEWLYLTLKVAERLCSRPGGKSYTQPVKWSTTDLLVHCSLTWF